MKINLMYILIIFHLRPLKSANVSGTLRFEKGDDLSGPGDNILGDADTAGERLLSELEIALLNWVTLLSFSSRLGLGLGLGLVLNERSLSLLLAGLVLSLHIEDDCETLRNELEPNASFFTLIFVLGLLKVFLYLLSKELLIFSPEAS